MISKDYSFILVFIWSNAGILAQKAKRLKVRREALNPERSVCQARPICHLTSALLPSHRFNRQTSCR